MCAVQRLQGLRGCLAQEAAAKVQNRKGRGGSAYRLSVLLFAVRCNKSAISVGVTWMQPPGSEHTVERNSWSTRARMSITAGQQGELGVCLWVRCALWRGTQECPVSRVGHITALVPLAWVADADDDALVRVHHWCLLRLRLSERGVGSCG